MQEARTVAQMTMIIATISLWWCRIQQLATQLTSLLTSHGIALQNQQT
jgi:hypothetical protein